MSPLLSQLTLLAIVAIPVGLGFWLEARRKRRVEDAIALARIRAAKVHDAEGEALPPVGLFEDFAARYPLPGRCRATASGNRCRHDADTGDLCDIHWKMALQGYPTHVDRDGAA